MSTATASMRVHRATTPPQVARLDAELAEFRESTAYQLAPLEDRQAAEAPMLAARRELVESFLRMQERHLATVRKVWLASTPAAVQRKKAIANPERAVAIGQLATLAGPLQASALAELLVAEQDAAGAFGLRMALQSFSAESHNGAVTVALKAGTEESDDALRDFLSAKREMSFSVGAVSDSAVEKLAAVHASQLVEMEDGSTKQFSEAEIEALIGV